VREIAALEDIPQNMRCAAKHLMAVISMAGIPSAANADR
jgi:hypothetical protein